MADVYPLQALLSVRWYREDAAKNAVRAAERKIQEARETAEKKRAALAEYRVWWPQEVDRRYQGIMGQTLDMDDLDLFHSGLAALADEELRLQQEVLDADKALQSCEAELKRAQAAVASARREAAKIETHRDIWKQEAKKEAERKEDLELEEFHPPVQESDEA